MTAPTRQASVEVRRCWFTMIRRPDGWVRIGPAYWDEKTARSWLSFVRKAWRAREARVSQCTLRLVDGVPDERSRLVLDRKFNIDVPTGAPHG